jgi:hypothetical protein
MPTPPAPFDQAFAVLQLHKGELRVPNTDAARDLAVEDIGTAMERLGGQPNEFREEYAELCRKPFSMKRFAYLKIIGRSLDPKRISKLAFSGARGSSQPGCTRRRRERGPT